MTISVRDRKLLWAHSHDACAMCKKPLTAEADSTALPGIVLGAEAHIVARSAGGPRGESGERIDLDTYENLILLCTDDHKRIDDQPEVYTPEVLRKMKVDHKKWTTTKLKSEPPPIRILRNPNEDQVPLDPMRSGAAIWNLMTGSHMYNFRTIEDVHGRRRVDLADNFLTTAQDWADIAEDVRIDGLHAIREAQRSLDEMLHELWENELWVYGRSLRRTITGGVGMKDALIYAELFVLTLEEIAELGSSDGGSTS